ncbi:hypothetical protein HY450_03060 [Candidatus Pacearchaeota archaeon]|nr:hypothetical protein [Candidatus Pacearchaeota archaeon]
MTEMKTEQSQGRTIEIVDNSRNYFVQGGTLYVRGKESKLALGYIESDGSVEIRYSDLRLQLVVEQSRMARELREEGVRVSEYFPKESNYNFREAGEELIKLAERLGAKDGRN